MSEGRNLYPEYHLLYQRLPAETSQAVHEQQAANLKLLAQVEMPIHIVIDTRLAAWQPTTLSEMRGVLMPMDSPNLRWVVLILNDSPVMKFLVSTANQISVKGGRLKLVDSLEEAFTFLQQQDSTLDLSSLLLEIEQAY